MGFIILGFLMYAIPSYLSDDWSNPWAKSYDTYHDGDLPDIDD